MATTNAVIDLSHHNSTVNLQIAKDSGGVLGVIHKCTEGNTFVDPTFTERRQMAKAAGLLWGSYHFGTGLDGVVQAVHFLEIAQPEAKDLLVLDFEHNPEGPTMALEEARAFVTHVQQQTGRWPGLYGGYVLKQLLGVSVDPVLSQCWLWLSQYGPTPIIPPNWTQWTMWQYTDGAHGPGPYSVPGIGLCDRDLYNGSADDLTSFW